MLRTSVVLASLAATSFVMLPSRLVSPATVQEPVARPPEAGVGGREAVAKADRALRAVRARAAGDGTFKKLADAPIVREGNLGRIALILACQTEERFLIPTRGEAGAVGGRGSFGVQVVFDDDFPWKSRGGQQCGVAVWNTNLPRAFVELTWCSADPGSPDRLLGLVREELGREGVTLVPVGELEWPYATTAERLSQLLPPGGRPSGPAKAAAVAAFEPEPPAFTSPSAVADAYRDALAKKDWKTYARCLTPASRAALFRQMLSSTTATRRRDLAAAIEKHLKCDVFDDEFGLRESKEMVALLDAPGHPEENDEATDAWLYGSLRRRVDDVPQLLADCLRLWADPPPTDPQAFDCKGIRIEGDRASGYFERPRPAPTPDEVERHGAIEYLPDHEPVRFRRINGSWHIVQNWDYE